MDRLLSLVQSRRIPITHFGKLYLLPLVNPYRLIEFMTIAEDLGFEFGHDQGISILIMRGEKNYPILSMWDILIYTEELKSFIKTNGTRYNYYPSYEAKPIEKGMMAKYFYNYFSVLHVYSCPRCVCVPECEKWHRFRICDIKAVDFLAEKIESDIANSLTAFFPEMSLIKLVIEYAVIRNEMKIFQNLCVKNIPCLQKK